MSGDLVATISLSRFFADFAQHFIDHSKVDFDVQIVKPAVTPSLEKMLRRISKGNP